MPWCEFSGFVAALQLSNTMALVLFLKWLKAGCKRAKGNQSRKLSAV